MRRFNHFLGRILKVRTGRKSKESLFKEQKILIKTLLFELQKISMLKDHQEISV